MLAAGRTILVLHDGYEFGWSFWVAVGTVLLAVATGVVALTTRIVANRTRDVADKTRELAFSTANLATRTAEDVAAQFRPVLAPDTTAANPVGFDRAARKLHLELVNCGRGPALDVQATVGDMQPMPWHNGVLPADKTARIEFLDVLVDSDRVAVRIAYRGLGREKYATTVSLFIGETLVIDKTDVESLTMKTYWRGDVDVATRSGSRPKQ